MIRFTFKGDEAKRRLETLRDLYYSAVFGFDLEQRSQFILYYHPEWLQVTRGDYVRFLDQVRAFQSAVVRGESRTAQEMHEAILEEYRPVLASRVGVDTGLLLDDVETAPIYWSRT